MCRWLKKNTCIYGFLLLLDSDLDLGQIFVPEENDGKHVIPDFLTIPPKFEAPLETTLSWFRKPKGVTDP